VFWVVKLRSRLVRNKIKARKDYTHVESCTTQSSSPRLESKSEEEKVTRYCANAAGRKAHN